MCLLCNNRSHFFASILYNAYNKMLFSIRNVDNKFIYHIDMSIKELICDVCIANIRYNNILITTPSQNIYLEIYTTYTDTYNELKNILCETIFEHSLYQKIKKDIDNVLCNVQNNIKIIRTMNTYYKPANMLYIKS